MANEPVKRGPATVGSQSDQPPKGAAKVTNQAIAAEDDMPTPQVEDALAGMETQEQEAPPQVATTPRTGGSMPKLNDEDAMALGPTKRPQETLTAGGGRANMQALPPDVYKHLQGLADTAKDPNAPPQLTRLVRILAQFLES